MTISRKRRPQNSNLVIAQAAAQLSSIDGVDRALDDLSVSAEDEAGDILHRCALLQGVEEFPRPPPDGVPAPAPDPPGELDRLEGAQRLDGHLGLRQIGTEPARGRRVGHQVPPAQRDPAGGGPQQADHLLHQRRLPRTVGTEQPVDLTGLDPEADRVVGDGPPPVHLGEIVDAQAPPGGDHAWSLGSRGTPRP